MQVKKRERGAVLNPRYCCVRGLQYFPLNVSCLRYREAFLGEQLHRCCLNTLCGFHVLHEQRARRYILKSCCCVHYSIHQREPRCTNFKNTPPRVSSVFGGSSFPGVNLMYQVYLMMYSKENVFIVSHIPWSQKVCTCIYRTRPKKRKRGRRTAIY